MPKTAITFGILLILLGLGGFGYAAATLPPDSSVTKIMTALIPAVLGLILVILGFLAKIKRKFTKTSDARCSSGWFARIFGDRFKRYEIIGAFQWNC